MRTTMIDINTTLKFQVGEAVIEQIRAVIPTPEEQHNVSVFLLLTKMLLLTGY